ncbi:MAG: hypothetical protein RLZZ469_1648 [Bacteroidota bacterium]
MESVNVINGKWVMTYISDTTLLETGQIEICDEAHAKDEEEALEFLNLTHLDHDEFGYLDTY